MTYEIYRDTWEWRGEKRRSYHAVPVNPAAPARRELLASMVAPKLIKTYEATTGSHLELARFCDEVRYEEDRQMFKPSVP